MHEERKKKKKERSLYLIKEMTSKKRLAKEVQKISK